MAIDLHMHTTQSDGKLTPAELVHQGYKSGLRIMSISDHDSVEGLDEALESAQQYPDLELIPGIELSTDIPGGEIHMLGYYMDYHDPDFLATLERFRESRVGRAHKMIEKLGQLGMPLSWERVRQIAGDGSIGRPHIAQALLEKGYVASLQEAFDRYLGRTGPAYAERDKLSPVEAVQLLKRVHGLPVLAHPGDIGQIDDIDALLSELAEAGMVGMEVYYGTYPPEKVEYLLALADRHRLIPLGGSDFHGLGNAYEGALGCSRVPLESVQRLKALAKAPLGEQLRR